MEEPLPVKTDNQTMNKMQFSMFITASVLMLSLSCTSCTGSNIQNCPDCGREICVCDRYSGEIDEPDRPVQPTGSKFLAVRDGKLVCPDGSEALLWGVNFQTPISWEYNRLSRVGVDKTAEALKAVADANLDDLQLMGVNHLRCHLTPADFTDPEGNIDFTSVYADALDYMISEAEKRSMYVSFAFLNHMGQGGPGTAWIGGDRATWIQDEAVVECVKRYVGQLVSHVNRYTGKALSETENIAFWELINEPEMYSWSEIKSKSCVSAYNAWLQSEGREDSETSYADYRTHCLKSYIDGMKSLLASKNDSHPVCWSLNWHRYRNGNEDIFKAVSQSGADIVAFCNYPGQDLAGSTYWDKRFDFTDTSFESWFNEQRSSINGYGWALADDFASKAKIVYEFETFFNQSAYLYPVQALYFRSLNVQSACMWTYTFNEIAPYMGGSHFLNLRCTPSKAVSFLIAQEMFRHLDGGVDFPAGPNECQGQCFAISKSRGGAVWSDGETFINSCKVDEGWNPLPPATQVKYVAGCADSPIVSWSGTGIYFIRDKGDELEIVLLPDAEVVGDLFSGATYGAAKTILSSVSKHSLSIKLEAWAGRSAVLWKIDETGNRKSLGHISGTAALNLSPGKYAVIPDAE